MTEKESKINNLVTAIVGKVASLISTHNSDNNSHSDIRNAINNLSTSGPVTVEKQDEAETGYVATYVIKQNGNQVGSKINIPKDFLVKSGTVETCVFLNQPVGCNVGDKYIDLVINTKANPETDEHIYIKVTDLIEGKVDIAQGSANANKTLSTDSSGNVITEAKNNHSHNYFPMNSKITASSTSIADLDNYKTAGFYYNNVNTESEYIIHCPNSMGTNTPYTNNTAFFLLVEDWGNDDYSVKQTLTYYQTGTTFTRIYVKGTGWQAWRTLLSNSNISSYAVQTNDSRLSDLRNPKFTQIPASSSNILDLDNYRQGGFYYTDSDGTIARYVQNCPYSTSEYGSAPFTYNNSFFLLVEVWKGDGTYSTYVKQTLTYYSSGKTFTRTRSGAGWQPWREIKTEYPFLWGNGGNTAAGYLKILQIKVLDTWKDKPITFDLYSRGRRSATKVNVSFSNEGDTDPDTIYLNYVDVTQSYNIYAYKEATSTWSIIIQKPQHDNVEVHNLKIPNYMGENSGVEVIGKNTYLSTLPTSTDSNPLVGAIGYGQVADNLTTNSSYKALSAAQGKWLYDNRANHTHAYLPTTGGTVTGGITYPQLRTETSGADSLPYAGAIAWDTNWMTTVKARKSMIGTIDTGNGWFNVLSIRHRNGTGDGNAWGMILKAPLTTNVTEANANLTWQRDLNGNASTEKTILDSNNYSTYASPKNHNHSDIQINYDSSVYNGLSPIDMSMIDSSNANRLAFMPVANIQVKVSTNGGSTWSDYPSLSNDAKLRMVSRAPDETVNLFSGGSSTAAASANNQIRIILDAGSITSSKNSDVYCSTGKKLMIAFTTAGATGTKVTVDMASYANPTSWVNAKTYDVGGWWGWNSIPFPYIFGGYQGQQTYSDHYRYIRLTFTHTGGSANPIVKAIRLYTPISYISPSNYAKSGHIYTYDTNQNVTFPAKIIKSGGTSSQFLKANGDVETLNTTSCTVTYTDGSTGTINFVTR